MSLPVLALVSALSRGAAAAAVSTLQARVDAAAPGARLLVVAGVAIVLLVATYLAWRQSQRPTV